MAASHIFDSFQVTESEARQHAQGIADLVESKGGDISAFTFVAFRDLVTRQLAGSKLPWRTNEAREAADAATRESKQFQNDYLNLRRNPLTREW
jgi:hypothetical protein